MQKIDTLPDFHIPSLFCADENAAFERVCGEDESGYAGISPQKGISSVYATTIETGGLHVSRQIVNSVGRLSSFALFLAQAGHLYVRKDGVTYGNYAALDQTDGILARRVVFTDGQWTFADNIRIPSFFDVD